MAFPTPRVQGLLLILGLALLFHILFMFKWRRLAILKENKRQPVRLAVREATGIAAAERGVGLAGIVPYLFITAIFGVLYAYIAFLILGIRLSPAPMRMIRIVPVGSVLVVILFSVLQISPKKRAVSWIYEPLRRADYDGALARADRLLRWFPQSPSFHFMRGTILFFAGRLPEAERVLRDSLEKGQLRADVAQTSRLGNLGYVWLAQGRWREAAAAFEGATKISPRNASAYGGLAELCLASDPNRALKLLDQALDLKRNDELVPSTGRHTLAYLWADRAQALAMLENVKDAAASLENAAKGNFEFTPGLAGTLWRCGVALKLMDRKDAAIEQFRRAKEIDPNGLYGNLAAGALREQS